MTTTRSASSALSLPLYSPPHTYCDQSTCLQAYRQPTLDSRNSPTAAAAAASKRPRPDSPSSPDKLAHASSSAKRPTLVHTPAKELEQLHISGDMGNQRATDLYNQLRALTSATNVNHTQVKQLLAQLKIELSELGLLVPDSSSLDTGALTTARDVLEIGAFESLRTDNLPGFERYLSLLSTYYNDLSSTLPRSAKESPLFALALLRLLSQNRIAEFHTLLETLGESKADVLESAEVSWVLQLERSLMEGSYSRVWSLCRPSSASSASLPLPEFSYFTPTLLKTVRNEIAACDERAYESLPLRDARTLLFFDSDQEVKDFAQSRDWYLDPSSSILHFPSSSRHPSRLNGTTASSAAQGVPVGMATGLGGVEEDSRELDRAKVVSATLKYARELESIV